jgi:hypothetical protein
MSCAPPSPAPPSLMHAGPRTRLWLAATRERLRLAAQPHGAQGGLRRAASVCVCVGGGGGGGGALQLAAMSAPAGANATCPRAPGDAACPCTLQAQELMTPSIKEAFRSALVEVGTRLAALAGSHRACTRLTSHHPRRRPPPTAPPPTRPPACPRHCRQPAGTAKRPAWTSARCAARLWDRSSCSSRRGGAAPASSAWCRATPAACVTKCGSPTLPPTWRHAAAAAARSTPPAIRRPHRR